MLLEVPLQLNMTASEQTAAFFRLPRELRDRIYALVPHRLGYPQNLCFHGHVEYIDIRLRQVCRLWNDDIVDSGNSASARFWIVHVPISGVKALWLRMIPAPVLMHISYMHLTCSLNNSVVTGNEYRCILLSPAHR